ncbi:MAG: HAD family hydrolase [Nostocales cyanobacterium 94392]|nr:HAD family hydrolase [Nostocales cyanobacterium 94392]
MTTIKCRDKAFSNIQAIIFDKNGTLENSEKKIRNFAQKAARIIDAQIPGIGEPLLMAFGVNGDILDAAGLMAVASRQETEIATAAYIAETGRGWIESLEIARKSLDEADTYLGNSAASLFPSSREILQKFSQAGLKLGILSAATTAEVNNFVTVHQLGEYINLEMGVDGNMFKPEPALFLQACEKLAVEASATLMVGDSIGDMQMARNAQAAGCIGITWIGRSDHVRGADVVINNLNEIQVD